MRGIWGSCSGPVEADHADRRGAGRKAHDSTCIPLCRYHHQASRFPRAWTQDQRRAWLHAAVVYTQACARAAGVEVPLDPAPMTEYKPSGPLSEWSEAAAFREVQEIAADALDPDQRDARIKVDEAVRAVDRHRVGALKRGERYFLEDMSGTTSSSS